MNAARSAPSRWKHGAPTRKRAAVPRTGRWARLQHLAINAFLLFHLLAITCWAIPFANPLTALSRSAVRPYFLWAGLFQSWDMFSPLPKSSNIYVEAIVLYEDGDTRNWAFPRMELLNLKDRYFKERYRKFVENLSDDAHAELWPDAARFIARVNSNRPARVKMVFLVRRWSAIVLRGDGSYDGAPWDAHIFYAHTTAP
jgi:hypothetical protein